MIPIAQIPCGFSFHILSKEQKFTLTKLLIGYRKWFVEKYFSNHLSNVFNFRFFSGLCFYYVSILLFPSEMNWYFSCICWQAWAVLLGGLDAWPPFMTHFLQDAHHSSSCSSSIPVNNTGPLDSLFLNVMIILLFYCWVTFQPLLGHLMLCCSPVNSDTERMQEQVLLVMKMQHDSILKCHHVREHSEVLRTWP